MTLEDILAYKDLGIGAISMVIFYVFAKSYREDFFKQLQDANKRGEESQQRFMTFIEGSYRENTKALSELISESREHIKLKNSAIEMLEERHRELEVKYEELKRYHSG
jgi:hypothetical protein